MLVYLLYILVMILLFTALMIYLHVGRAEKRAPKLSPPQLDTQGQTISEVLKTKSYLNLE